jgi:hypothetical protein
MRAAFTFGLIVGAGVCYAVVRFTAPAPSPDTKPVLAAVQPNPPAAAPPTEPPSCPEITSASAPTQVEPKVADARAPERPVGNSQPDTAVSTPVAQRRLAIDEISEDEANRFCSAVFNRQQQRDRAAKEAEPKDVSWAYSTEQLIQQHVEMNMSPAQYNKLRIECRTTFCEMRIEGVGGENKALASEIAQGIAQQPWHDMLPRSGSVYDTAAGWQVIQEWVRPKTGAENKRSPKPRN